MASQQLHPILFLLRNLFSGVVETSFRPSIVVCGETRSVARDNNQSRRWHGSNFGPYADRDFEGRAGPTGRFSNGQDSGRTSSNYYAISRREAVAVHNFDEYQDFLAGLAEEILTDPVRAGGEKISLGRRPSDGVHAPWMRTIEFRRRGSGASRAYNDIAYALMAKASIADGGAQQSLPGLQLVNSIPMAFFMAINPAAFLIWFTSSRSGVLWRQNVRDGICVRQYNPLHMQRTLISFVFWR
nr:GDSL esterase/lipase At2g04570-like [Ipomoea batatas]